MDPKLLAAIIAVLMGLASVLGAVATYIKSRSEVGGIKADREKTKLSRDRETEDLRVRISVLEKQDEFMSARVDKGDERFDKLEDKISETNGLLREILGEFKYISGTKKRAHVPEDRPL